MAGVQAAALAGLAITPLTRSGFVKGLEALGPNKYLPPLPEAQFAIIAPTHRLESAAMKLAEAIKNTAHKLYN